MKKLLSICLVLSLMLALTACGGNSTNDGSEGKTPSPAPSGAVAAPDRSSQPSDTLTPTPDEEKPLSVTPEAPSPSSVPAEENPINTDGIDIDLSQMSGMMAYAELSNIIYYADDYVGKVIRMTGTAVSYYDEQTDTQYYAVMILDATACCSSGFDLLLAEGQTFPENGQEITVTGELEIYEPYEGIQFLRLKDAVVDAQS